MADRTVEEIKDRVDIVDLISSYVQLKKSGTNFKGLCPFHNEKSGSFMVSPTKQIFHCFGCGEGGDIFEFVKKIENVEFRDALKLLADRAGVKLPEYSPRSKEQTDRKEILYKINAFAAQYYHKYLLSKQGVEALRYLVKRGLTNKTIEEWQIGLAGEGFHDLEEALLKKNLRVVDLLEAGVSVKSEKGRVFDRFRGRITFPIYNYVGECVGFSARILKEEKEMAKYINSPETSIYNKSKILFGLHKAKSEIRKKNYAIIVEGQMDCIKSQQEGFLNVVATSGTALTLEQLQLLKRLSSNIIFAFDNDAAGKKAMKRAAELAYPLGFALKVADLGTAKDPDELISESKTGFIKAIKNASWVIDYFILEAQAKYKTLSVEQKKFVTSEILPLIAMMPDPVEREHYLEKLSSTFSISTTALGMLSPVIEEPKPEVKFEKGEPEVVKNMEKEVFGGFIYFPEFRDVIISEIDPAEIETPEIKQFFEMVKNGQTESDVFKNLVNSTLAKEAVFVVELKLTERQQNKEAVVGELTKSFYLFRLNRVKQLLLEIPARIKQAELARNSAGVAGLTQEFTNLQNLRKKYESFL